MKITGILLLVLCFIIPPGEAVSARNDAKKIVGRVEKTLKKLETLRCYFEQVIYRKADDRTVRRTGTLYMKDPYLFRLEDPAKTVVGDGESVWMYIPKNNQVQISDFIPGEDNFPSPLSIFEKYVKSREAEVMGQDKVNGKMCDVLLLVSSNPWEDNVTAWIDSDLNFPVKTFEELVSGDSVQYVLREVVLNEKFEDEIFTFITPEGVETIDLRE